jgi:hypothetical protein
MTCLELLKMLYPYLDHELYELDCKEVEIHIKQCVTCAQILEQEGKVSVVVRQHLATYTRVKAPNELMSTCQQKLLGK